MTGDGDLVIVGDAHLDRNDPNVDAFVAAIERLDPRTRKLILLGDLFNIWIGRKELEQSHHRVVVEALVALRRRGVVVRYVEGNRDYRIGPLYAGTAFDDVTEGALVEKHAGLSLVAVHGDLANAADRQYRIWRRWSRSRVMWALFRLLPSSRRFEIAERLEAGLRRTNLERKTDFPERAIREYAARWLASGHDAVVLGHFHVEAELRPEPASVSGKILITPLWSSTRRVLSVGEDGVTRFVSL